MAVYFACLEPGDTILAMDLAHGGHLTHGMHLNFSGKFYKVVSYGVTPRHRAHRLRPGGQPGTRAQAEADRRRGQRLSARASTSPRSPRSARKTAPCSWWTWPTSRAWWRPSSTPSPVPFADFVTSTTHKTLRGPRGGFVLCKKDWAQKINSAVFPGLQGGPLMHVIAAKAVGFGEALQAGVPESTPPRSSPTPGRWPTSCNGSASASSPAAPTITCCWWTSPREGVTGKIAEQALDAAGITVNKNMIPFDTRPPLDPSGIRIGTPALTTRGMREPEMRTIAGWIGRGLSAPEDHSVQKRVRGQVRELCQQFPAPTTPE